VNVKLPIRLKRLLLGITLLTLGACLSSAQDETEFILPLEELADQARAFTRDQLDTNLLQQFPEMDREKAQQLARDFQQQLQGDYVVDLAAIRGLAQIALPILEQYPETEGLGIWLRARMDYLSVADRLTINVPAPDTEVATTPSASSTPLREREVWVEEVRTRPWPPASSNYVSQLKPVFATQKVPPELIWIAEAESSFDPRAESPVGAAGLFQLMPATAKRFGLELWPRDQRLQPEPSATAAGKYLRYLHGKFGDWRLALTAYNAGEGRVQRLLKSHNARSFDEISPHLPAETQLFVPKVEALVLQREGVKLEELGRLPQ